MEKKAGFTLVEVMIVIAVFAIMAAVAIPAFMSLLPGMRLNGAARQVAGDLMAARMKAVKLNQKTKVTFDGTAGYEIWNDADNGGNVADNEGDDVERSIHPDYHDVTFNTVSTVFSPRGTAGNCTITLTQTPSNSTKSITISIAGRVKIN